MKVVIGIGNRGRRDDGIGPALVERLTRIGLHVFAHNTAARALYEQLGFTGTGRKDVVAVSFLAAWLSYRYVERPFRRRSAPAPVELRALSSA